jgi:hypothetical protein
MPCRRQCARTARIASGGITQPVGFPGELIISSRVSGVSAASSRSTSRRQRPPSTARATVSTRAPSTAAIAVRFGHNGTTATTRSPGDSSAWAASISAETPELVTPILPAPIGAPPPWRRPT